MNRSSGFTLIELLVTLGVIAILLTIALPSMKTFFDRERIIDAAEQIYSHLQQARIESIARSQEIYFKVSANGASWKYGVSQNAACDLDLADTSSLCVLVVDDGLNGVDPGDGSVDPNDLVLMRFTNVDHEGIEVTGGDFQITFENIRGTAEPGQIDLKSPLGRRLRITIGALGQLRICTPDESSPPVSGYRSCA